MNKLVLYGIFFFIIKFNIIYAEELSAKQFLINLINNNHIGKESCKPTFLYVQCYDVNQTVCEAMMLNATQKCYKKYEHTITEEQSFSDLRETVGAIGSCAGTMYDIALTIMEKANHECLNDPKWGKVLQENANKYEETQ